MKKTIIFFAERLQELHSLRAQDFEKTFVLRRVFIKCFFYAQTYIHFAHVSRMSGTSEPAQKS